jgi:hypothetical protein
MFVNQLLLTDSDVEKALTRKSASTYCSRFGLLPVHDWGIRVLFVEALKLAQPLANVTSFSEEEHRLASL